MNLKQKQNRTHEVYRVFADRLVDTFDLQKFFESIKVSIRKIFYFHRTKVKHADP